MTKNIEKKMSKPFKMSFNSALFGIFLILFIGIGLVNRNFFNANYLITVMLRNIVELGIMALPVTLIIITGGIDLSVGSIMVLSAMSGGLVATSTNTTAGLIVCLLVGTLCGLINGLIIVKVNINPLITTLATMFLFRGIAKGMTTGDSVYSHPIATFFGTMELAGIPLQIFMYIVLVIIFYLLLHKTILGRDLYAIGFNENATKYSGINTDKIKIAIYTLSGFMCSIASLIWLGRFTSIKFDGGNDLNLKVITIIVLGGASINGGSGDIRGTMIATLIIAVLNSGLTVLNIPIAVQTIVQGTVLVISLIIYSFLQEHIKKSRIIKNS